MLMGCGLRRAELVGLGLEDFQVREEHGGLHPDGVRRFGGRPECHG
jgi:integrase